MQPSEMKALTVSEVLLWHRQKVRINKELDHGS